MKGAWEHKKRQYTYSPSLHFCACHGDKMRGKGPGAFSLYPPHAPGEEYHFFNHNLTHQLPHHAGLCAMLTRLQKKGLGPESNPSWILHVREVTPMPKSVHYWSFNSSGAPIHVLPKFCRFCLIPAPGDILFPLSPPGFWPPHWWHHLHDDNILPSPSAGVCLAWALS